MLITIKVPDELAQQIQDELPQWIEYQTVIFARRKTAAQELVVSSELQEQFVDVPLVVGAYITTQEFTDQAIVDVIAADDARTKELVDTKEELSINIDR